MLMTFALYDQGRSEHLNVYSENINIGPFGRFDVSFTMKDITNYWIEWWNTENIVTHAIWHNNMEIFVTASESLLHYDSQDIVLDIGSGPGYLAAFLKGRVKEIHCLDTSQRYLDMCKDKFVGDNNIFVYKLNEDNYTDLSFLRDKTFSIIICQSVIQYYKDMGEVERLIKEVWRVALPGARFLIADIPIASSLTAHVYGLLKGAFRKNRLLEISKMLFQTVASAKHRTAYLSSGLLTFSDEKLKALIGKLDLDADVLTTRLTVNENRKHLLIRF
jgi:ubiquinone/menaquinone biosynthesis C-methylase UbiE